MATYQVIGTGPKRDCGTILHSGREYKPGDAFPAGEQTATEEQIEYLIKRGQLVKVEPAPAAPAPIAAPPAEPAPSKRTK